MWRNDYLNTNSVCIKLVGDNLKLQSIAMFIVTDVQTVFTTNMQVWLWSISLQHSLTKLYGSLVMAVKLTDICYTKTAMP